MSSYPIAFGVGLGLEFVKEMVHALGGRIERHSQVGAGSMFTVLLPPVPEKRGDEGEDRQTAGSVETPSSRGA